jgi:hypothetical protein
MKRLRSWLFNGLAALSLAACLATACMWIRSYWYANNFWVTSANSATGTVIRTNIVFEQSPWAQKQIGVAFVWTTVNEAPQLHSEFGHYEGPLFFRPFASPPTYAGLAERLGFRFTLKTKSSSPGMKSKLFIALTCPDWSIFLLLLAMPVIWIVATLRKPIHRGVCEHCGYDLRATPDRCPECGNSTLEREKSK